MGSARARSVPGGRESCLPVSRFIYEDVMTKKEEKKESGRGLVRKKGGSEPYFTSLIQDDVLS